MRNPTQSDSPQASSQPTTGTQFISNHALGIQLLGLPLQAPSSPSELTELACLPALLTVIEKTSMPVLLKCLTSLCQTIPKYAQRVNRSLAEIWERGNDPSAAAAKQIRRSLAACCGFDSDTPSQDSYATSDEEGAPKRKKIDHEDEYNKASRDNQQRQLAATSHSNRTQRPCLAILYRRDGVASVTTSDLAKNTAAFRRSLHRRTSNQGREKSNPKPRIVQQCGGQAGKGSSAGILKVPPTCDRDLDQCEIVEQMIEDLIENNKTEYPEYFKCTCCNGNGGSDGQTGRHVRPRDDPDCAKRDNRRRGS
ncbi:MAG: hypothetical protein Q9173_002386 [Seirophora scorigena]